MAKDVLNKSKLADEHEHMLNKVVYGIEQKEDKKVKLTPSTIMQGIILSVIMTYVNIQIFGNNIWEALVISLFSVVLGFIFARYVSTQML